MYFVSEIEPMSLTGVFQWCSTIDEKHSVFSVVFVAAFGNERVSKHLCSGRLKRCSGRLKRCLEYFVCV